MSVGIASAAAITAASTMTMHGVPRAGAAGRARWGSGGWWRATARARETPSIAEFAAADQRDDRDRGDDVRAATSPSRPCVEARGDPDDRRLTQLRRRARSCPCLTGSAVIADERRSRRRRRRSSPSRRRHEPLAGPRRVDVDLAGQARRRLEAGEGHRGDVSANSASLPLRRRPEVRSGRSSRRVEDERRARARSAICSDEVHDHDQHPGAGGAWRRCRGMLADGASPTIAERDDDLGHARRRAAPRTSPGSSSPPPR